MIRTLTTRRGVLAIAALAVLLGCDSAANPIGPENQLEVTNAVDQFQFQLTGLDEVTDSRRYEWENTGSQAKIDVSQAITGGSALLTIRDATGAVMYSADIAQDSDTNTPDGAPGTWTVEVVLADVQGTFNFRVQKVT